MLARLVGSTGAVGDFGAHGWGRRPWLTRAAVPADEGFTDLLTRQDVDELCSVRAVRTPFVRVAKDGDTLPNSAFTAGGGVGAGIADQVSDDRLHRLFADGATIVLQGLHRLWPPVLDFAQALAAELGHPVQVNAYVTPPQSRGFATHHDVHDVFVLQLFGSKRWHVHEPVQQWPLRSQEWTGYRAQVEAAAASDAVLDAVLQPGDCLYLPRGYLHAATALGQISGHLTVGVHPWTEHTLAEELTALALAGQAEAVDARAPLPLRPGVGTGSEGPLLGVIERVRHRLHEAIDAVPAERLAEALASRAGGTQRAAPLRPLSQTLATREAGPDTGVVCRAHLQVRRRPLERGGVRLTTRVGVVDVPAEEVTGLDDLLDGSPVTPAELPLPEDTAVSLVIRLLAAGLLLPVTEPGSERPAD